MGDPAEARRTAAPAAARRREPPEQPAEAEELLYAKRKRIYPRQVRGVFARLRVLGVLTLLGIYYLLPWVPWEGRQAVLFDLPARKFYIFDLVFWPQDFFYLALLLILAAYALFFFTTLAGRLWCGYACPQTVWTEVFMWIERKVEGDRNRRMKLDRAPWDARKLRIKAVKHALWVLFALWTGFLHLLGAGPGLVRVDDRARLVHVAVDGAARVRSGQDEEGQQRRRDAHATKIASRARPRQGPGPAHTRAPPPPRRGGGGSRAARAGGGPTPASSAWATAWTARSACRSAPWASTSATASSTSASAARPASTPATR